MQHEMRQTSTDAYSARQKWQARCKEFKQVVEEVFESNPCPIDGLQRHPCATVCEATYHEWLDLRDKLGPISKRLKRAAVRLREADDEYNSAHQQANEAYREHNGLSY